METETMQKLEKVHLFLRPPLSIIIKILNFKGDMTIHSLVQSRQNASTAVILLIPLQELKLTVGKAQKFASMVKSIKVFK